MSACPKCQTPVYASAVECPRCGVIFTKAHEDPPLVRVQAAEPAPQASSYTRYYFFAFLFLAMWAWHKRPPPKMPDYADQSLIAVPGSRSLASTDAADPCQDRPHCAYLYIAPWCPHCHEFLPQIPRIRDYWKDPNRPGLKVVIGWDNMGAIQGMAAEINPPLFADESATFRKSLQLKSVPYLMIVDRNRKIVAQGRAAFDWLNDEINAHP